MSLKSKLALRFLLVLVVYGALLFIPAGSLRFWQGWVYILTSFVSALFAFAYFYRRDPELIERRLKMKEEVREQKRIMAFVYITWLIAFVLPGLDHRFGWSHSPLWLTIFSQAVALCGFGMTLWVMKVNRFASRTIQVEPGQELISGGRSSSHVFGRLRDVAIHTLGSGLLLDLASVRSPHPANRFPTLKRGKDSAPRTTRLRRILPPNPLPARSLPMVSDIFSKARRSR
jgi:protein-S-isoprenylcysteine O-methyltransferase Ste14